MLGISSCFCKRWLLKDRLKFSIPNFCSNNFNQNTPLLLKRPGKTVHCFIHNKKNGDHLPKGSSIILLWSKDLKFSRSLPVKTAQLWPSYKPLKNQLCSSQTINSLFQRQTQIQHAESSPGCAALALEYAWSLGFSNYLLIKDRM